ncbi:MAG: arylmalonate decarboxylase [Bryobacteraceae bacterium]
MNYKIGRREFLLTTAAATAITPAAVAAERTVGMIFPPDAKIPPDGRELYPSGVTFLGEGLNFKGMTPESFDEAVPRIVPAALRLKEQGAAAISIMGTSLTFYKGAAFNRELIESVQRATGLPTTSMSSGIVDGLHVAGAKRLAVATAYTDVINIALKKFLEESGFTVLGIKGFNLLRVTPEAQGRLFDFSAGVFEEFRSADTLLVSCGGFRTLDLLAALEEKCKVPVVSSTPHAFMNAVRLVGMDPRRPNFGRVLAKA